MKLFDRYNRVNLLTTITVLAITGIIYYGAISFILNHQVDKDIAFEEKEVNDFIGTNERLPSIIDYKGQKINFRVSGHKIPRHFIDTNYYDKRENDYPVARALIYTTAVNGLDYRVEIIKSKVETEDLIQIIFIITIGLIIFVVIILLITNRFVLRRIWQPFYGLMAELKDFNLSDHHEIKEVHSSVDEFSELNLALINMSARVKKDYKELKTFTENASHELLTPIAVINSKLDSLIQTENFSETQSKLLTDVYGAVSRLTRINQSLLLLVKIENSLVKDETHINLKTILEEKIAQFNELFLDKSITVNCTLVDREINASRYLIEILLNNLLSNALRHNVNGGDIQINLSNEWLQIKNTGLNPELSTGEIFKRFNKSAKSEGSGLGLTIAQQICENYHYNIAYSYLATYHVFTVTFK